MKEHIILGIDEGDVEKQKDLWLSENPAIKIVTARMRREPRNLLSLLGGPRFSITLEYEDPDSPSTFTADVGRNV
jgi:hypothetical protein